MVMSVMSVMSVVEVLWKTCRLNSWKWGREKEIGKRKNSSENSSEN